MAYHSPLIDYAEGHMVYTREVNVYKGIHRKIGKAHPNNGVVSLIGLKDRAWQLVPWAG